MSMHAFSPRQLVEVINEDYADYVGLSGRLANVEGSVLRMRKPLLELRVRPCLQHCSLLLSSNGSSSSTQWSICTTFLDARVLSPCHCHTPERP